MKINEDNFIKYLKQEKEDALEYVIDHYLPLIKGIVLKVIGPLHQNETIKECINDILFSIWTNSKSFQGNAEDFKKWICIISKYKAIDYYRTIIKKNEANFFDMDLKFADPIVNLDYAIEEQQQMAAHR